MKIIGYLYPKILLYYMTILPKKWIPYEKTIYLEDYYILIVSDIHLGRCDSSEFDKEFQYNEKYERLNNSIEKFNPKTLILNGDTFYNQFNGCNPMIEDEYAISILRKWRDSVDEFLLLEGNHELTLDGFTDNIKDEFNVGMYKRVDDILIHHGHNEPAQEAKHNIIGHVHPRRDGDDVFHYCSNGYEGSSVTILPTFCKYVDGVDIDYYDGICPILDDGIDSKEYKCMKA
jgi:metallophosphoesterase superfamily enzyme